MPDSTDNPKSEEIVTRTRHQETFLFWYSVLLGTAAAGGVFGFLFGCSSGSLGNGFLGLGVGFVFASILGVFAIANMLVVAWCFWSFRFPAVLGGLTGGLAGFLASVIADLPEFTGEPLAASWKWLALAGLLGAVGGGLAGGWYDSRAKSQGLHPVFRQHRWRFTLRDLFIRIAVISALLAAYVFAVNLILAR